MPGKTTERFIHMWQLGADNWISYGWGPDMRNERYPNDSLDNFLYMDFSNYKVPTTVVRPTSASIAAVNNIVANYPGPYTLMCSGGIDSQAMIWAWSLTGLPFNILSIRYVSDNICFNEHDLGGLHQFCELHGFEITYKDFDVINFLENDLPDTSVKYDCDSPQFCTHIKMSECVPEGTIMFSGNYINGTFGIGYTMLGLHRYAVASRTPTRAIIPSFFLHSPELAFSFINKKSHPATVSTRDIYTSAGFPVLKQQKYNGFEELKNYYDKYTGRVTGRTRLLYSSKPSNRVFDLLFRYPYHVSNTHIPIRTVIQLNEVNT